jgi:hypothetical protein
MAQKSPVFGFLVADFDRDGNLDAVATGNFYPNEAHLGRQDASRGLWLKGNGHGAFVAISNAQSGLNISGDARRSYSIDPQRFFTLVNSGAVITHRIKE